MIIENISKWLKTILANAVSNFHLNKTTIIKKIIIINSCWQMHKSMLVSEHLKCKALYVVYSTRCNFSQILRLWKSSWQLMLHLKVHTPSKSLPSFSCTVGYIVRSNSLSPNMQKYPAPPACLTVFYNNHRGVNISILHWHSDTSHTLHLPDAHFIPI